MYFTFTTTKIIENIMAKILPYKEIFPSSYSLYLNYLFWCKGQNQRTSLGNLKENEVKYNGFNPIF